MEKVKPVFLHDDFRVLNSKLLDFLRALSDEEWHRQTISPQWVVKDVAAHLLDGNVRRISVLRDSYLLSVQIDSYKDLVDHLNRLNAEWVKAFKRVSPQVLIELLEITGDQVYQIFRELPPFEKAVFPVSWAGEEESANWFDIAREYTEKWLHQQQIRDAFADTGILNKRFFFPCLDIFMRGLPYTYREVQAEKDTAIKITVLGDGGGQWYLKKADAGWELMTGENSDSQAQAILDVDTAWKLFSRAIKDPKQARLLVQFRGDRKLAEKVVDMVSVMA